MKKKRILQLLYSDDTSIGNVRREISRSFSKCETEITIAFLTGEQHTQYADNEQSLFLGFSRRSIKHQYPTVFFKLYTFLKQGNFDVILCHRSKTLSLIQKINKLLKIKQCIFIAHNFSEFKRRPRRLSLLLFSDHRWQYIGISEAISEHLKTLNNGCIAEQVFTIENAIDCDKTISQLYPKQAVRTTLKLPHDKFIFGSVGRITRSKGQYDLVQAFHLVHQVCPDSCLVLIGSGPDYDRINNYIDEHQLNDSVFLLGFLPDASRYMAAFDIFVLPSHKEGFGLVLIEAMAAKLPIIATNTGGIPNVLGSEGALVPVSDITALASSMTYHNELDAEQLSQTADRLHQRLLTHFNIHIFQEKYRSLVYSDSINSQVHP
jgi:glycosyltransferase involved in cell wall biosynthesis